MTVAVVHFIVDPVLGAGTAVKSVALARAFAAAGVRTRLITTDIGLHERPLPAMPGVELSVIPSTFQRFPIPRAGSRRIARLIAGCDGVILVSHWTLLHALAYRAARRLGVPFFVLPAGALRIQGRSRWLKHLYQLLVGRRLLRDASAVIATTPLEAAQLRDDGSAVSRVRVIPNGIDPEPRGSSGEQFRADHGLPTRPLVLFMGRLNPIKGPDLLLEAFARIADRFPEWHLVVAGRDEGLQGALRLRTSALGLGSRVHFVGHLEASQATGAFRAASLLAVPSRHEAMSLVALEAAVVGTPVLLTDACGFDEVQQVDGGRVVRASVDGLADGLNALLARSPELSAMGARLREFVIGRYGWPALIQHYLSLVREVQSGARRAE